MSGLTLNFGLQRFHKSKSTAKSVQIPKIYAVGVNSADGSGAGIYVYDESFNYLDEYHALLPIYNGSSYGEIFFGNPSPRDINIDNEGRFYIADWGYGNRLYRLTPDFILDETFLFDGSPYLKISDTSFPESIAVDNNGVMYIGNRTHQVYVYQPDGTNSDIKDLSSVLNNNLIGAIVIVNDNFYVTDKDVIYKFDSNWNYLGSSWNSTFVDTVVHATNLYGLTKLDNGFAAVDIEEDELIIYDNNFQPISYVNHNSTVTSIRGVLRIPVIKTGDEPAGLPEFAGTGFFIDFGDNNYQSPGNWNNITAINQASTQLIDSEGNSTSIYLAITTAFKSIDLIGGHTLGGIPFFAMEDSFVLRGWDNNNSVIELTGLNAAKTYTIKLYASNTDENSTTDFWINGVKKSVDAHDNYTEVVVYENISPDGNNKILVEVNTNDNYSFLNAMTIEENI